MNTYIKFCPNVFAALCEDEHEKGETIILTTKRGKENEHIVHNFLGMKNGMYMYSITRADGYNVQEHARRKAEKIQGFAANADKRADQFYKKSRENSEFLSLGEPIKVGHHSENRHRKMIQQACDNTDKWVKESDKAEAYRQRAEYYQKRENEINLSMPESVDFYRHKLEEATKRHADLKQHPEKREHSYSLTYANNDVKKAKENLSLALRLWGDQQEGKAIEEEMNKGKKSKADKMQEIREAINNLGGFYAFNDEQFKEGYQGIIDAGHLSQGDKVVHIFGGLYVPKANAQKVVYLLK